MIRKKVFAGLLLTVLLPFFCSGCWDREEINDLAIVRAIAIDYLPEEEEPFFISLAVIKPSENTEQNSNGSNGTLTKIFSGQGKTLYQAMEQIRHSLARRIYLAHNEVILISEVTAREEGLSSIKEFVIRSHELRLTNNVLVVPGKAFEILHVSEIMGESISDEILDLINQSRFTPESDPRQVFEILRAMSSPGEHAYTAMLQPVPTVNLSSIASPGEETEEGEGEKLNPDTQLFLSGSALFRNNIMAGTLDMLETRGLLWLKGRITKAIMSVPDPLQNGEVIDVRMNFSKVDITAAHEDESISFQVEITTEGDLISQSGSSRFSKTTLKEVNTALSGIISEDIEAALAKLKSSSVDAVGFGAVYYRKYPQKWREIEENWADIFPAVEIDVTVNSHLRRTGLLSRPFKFID